MTAAQTESSLTASDLYLLSPTCLQAPPTFTKGLPLLSRPHARFENPVTICDNGTFDAIRSHPAGIFAPGIESHENEM